MEPLKLLQIAVWLFTGIVGLCYGYQILYILLPVLTGRRNIRSDGLSPTARCIAILIAARNEETVLPHLLDSIRAQEYPADKVGIFVAADNCQDGTAAAALAGGAHVYIRENHCQVGKGYALDWLLEQMRQDGSFSRFDGFLVLDADNLLSPDYLRQMNRMFCETDGEAPRYDIITGYRNTKNFRDNWLAAGYGLWFLHDSGHLNASRQKLGLSCTLSGTGILFRRSFLEALGGWPYHTLTEDLECTAACISAGKQIGYTPDAVLYDEQPADFIQSVRQRIRWAQGGIQVSLRYGGALLRGMFCLPGWRRKYACLENLTLSLWGYLAAVLGTCGTLLTAFLCGTLLETLVMLTGMFLLSGWGMGMAVILTEGRRIPGGFRSKGCAVLGFPLFLAGFALSAVLALFVPRNWKPIRHTAALSLTDVVGNS